MPRHWLLAQLANAAANWVKTMIQVRQMLPDARGRLFVIEDDRPLTDAASLLADTTPPMVMVCDRRIMVGPNHADRHRA